MMRPWLAGIAVATVTFTGITAPSVHAYGDVECANRGKAHIEHHGGLAEDNRWHVMHAELPTCNPDHRDALSCTGIMGELEHDADDPEDKLAGHCHESTHDADEMEQRAEQAEYDAQRAEHGLTRAGRDAEHDGRELEHDGRELEHGADTIGKDGLHDVERGGHDLKRGEHDADTVLHDVEHDGPGHHK